MLEFLDPCDSAACEEGEICIAGTCVVGMTLLIIVSKYFSNLVINI